MAEDTATGNKVRRTFDMVVLAAGMVPSTKTDKLPLAVKYTDEGFIDPTGLPAGVHAVGSLKSPWMWPNPCKTVPAPLSRLFKAW